MIYNTDTYKAKRPQRGRTIHKKNSAATCATAEFDYFVLMFFVKGRALDLLRRRQYCILLFIDNKFEA